MSLSANPVLDSEFDSVEVGDVGGSYGNYKRVGQGQVTCPSCSTFKGWVGCLRTELHDKTVFDSMGNCANHKGEVFVHPVFWSCDRPSCPRCFKHGWAVRESQKIAKRFAGANKSVSPEHVVVSPSKKDWALSV